MRNIKQGTGLEIVIIRLVYDPSANDPLKHSFLLTNSSHFDSSDLLKLS
jgi:hypothetical protein